MKTYKNKLMKLTKQLLTGINQRQSSTEWPRRALFPALLAAVLAVVASSANAVTELGNPYTPPGADFSIYAEQNVNLSTGNGQGGTPKSISASRTRRDWASNTLMP